MANDSGIGETAGSVGGWFGDIMEGLKPAFVDAAGYTIRSKAGLLDREQYETANQPTQPQVVYVPQDNSGGGNSGGAGADNQTLVLVGLGVVAFMVLADDD